MGLKEDFVAKSRQRIKRYHEFVQQYEVKRASLDWANDRDHLLTEAANEIFSKGRSKATVISQLIESFTSRGYRADKRLIEDIVRNDPEIQEEIS